MNLLHLAPDIQEELLFLPLIERGRDTLLERHLRPIMAEVDWRKQRRMWKELRAVESPDPINLSNQSYNSQSQASWLMGDSQETQH